MKPALITIDIQKGFASPYWGRRNNPQFEHHVETLLHAWRTAKLPIIHVQHRSTEPNSPLRPDQPGVEFMDFAQPTAQERVITKTVNSAFIGTKLEALLRSEDFNLLVLVGLTSDHCVSTTARMAKNLGFQVILASDATATFDRVGYDGKHYAAELVHNVSLASLHREFVTVQTTEQILSSLRE